MGYEDEPTDEYRFIGRARPPQSPGDADFGEPEPGVDDPPCRSTTRRVRCARPRRAPTSNATNELTADAAAFAAADRLIASGHSEGRAAEATRPLDALGWTQKSMSPPPGRTGRGRVLLRLVRHDGLGGEEQRRDRGGVLQRRAGHLGRVDDARP